MIREAINGCMHRHQFRFDVGFIHPKPFIKALNSHFGDRQLIGAEIGVYRGQNAESMLKNLKLKKLYLVDPYEELDDGLSQDSDENLCAMDKRIRPFITKVSYQFMDSDSFFAQLKEPLDFVYIDGDHSYAQVKKDLDNAYNHVRSGGLICGDDFAHKDISRAVIELAMQHAMFESLWVERQDYWMVRR